MITTDLRRIIKTGFIDFWRNSVTSLAAILVFTITLFVIATLILGSAFLDSSIETLKSKVDINVYINEEAIESDILSLKESLEALPEVKKVEYLSREQVLEQFIERKKNNETILQSLDEVEENPFRAELRINAQHPSQYESIAKFLEGDNAISQNVNIIAKINYFENQKVIERLTSFISLLERIGPYVSLVFIFIAVVVAFNTITLVIFTARDEITVMRLVGAGNMYIRGPFIIEGIMYGVISTVIVLLILYPITKLLSSIAEKYGGLDIFNYFTQNILYIGGAILASGVLLGMISSFLAVKRYLKV